MSVNSNTSIRNIQAYFEDSVHVDTTTQKKKMLVVDANEDGSKVVKYRTLTWSLRDTALRIERFFGCGDASFSNIAKFSAQNKILVKLEPEVRNPFLQKITKYNNEHTWARSVLRVNVQTVIQGMQKPSESVDATIVRALKDGDLEAAAFIIKNTKKIDVNYIGKDDSLNLFNHAVMKGNKEIVELLISHLEYHIHEYRTLVIKIYYSEPGNTSLMLAIQEGKNEIVELIVERLAPWVGTKNKEGNTCIHEAIVKNLPKNIISLLFEATLSSKGTVPDLGSPVYMKNVEGQTAVHIAAQNGREDILKFFSESEVDLNVKNEDGNTALASATQLGLDNIVTYLLDQKNVNPNPYNNEKQTPLDLVKDNSSLEQSMRDKGCKTAEELKALSLPTSIKNKI